MWDKVLCTPMSVLSVVYTFRSETNMGWRNCLGMRRMLGEESEVAEKPGQEGPQRRPSLGAGLAPLGLRSNRF